MTDEKFVFIEDCKDKKRTARGAFNKRTHCGKGGAIMFPSDYLTTKEKKAMNGECKAYRMNDPMKWDEFKAMPTDLQRDYIRALREKFGAHDKAIATMLGVTNPVLSRCNKVLGLSLGKGNRPGKFDEEAWTRWVNGLPAATDGPQVTCYDEAAEVAAEATEEFMTEEVKEYVEQDVQNTKDIAEAIEEMQAERTGADDLPNEVDYIRVPHYGNDSKVTIRGGTLNLEGNLYHIMTRLINIIGDVNVEMTVVWDLKED